MNDRMTVSACAGALLAVCLACDAHRTSSAPDAKLDVSPGTLCREIERKGIGTNCTFSGSKSALLESASFDVASLPGYRAQIRKYNAAKEYEGFAADATGQSLGSRVAADNYPSRPVLVPEQRMIIDWEPPEGTTTVDGSKWETCMKSHKQAVFCAKAQPTFYAANKALFDTLTQLANE